MLTVFAIDKFPKHLVIVALSPGNVQPVTPYFDRLLSFNEGLSFGHVCPAAAMTGV